MTEDLTPRNRCISYIFNNNKKSEDAVLVTKDLFDILYKSKKFSDGPFMETFGDRHGEPYNPFKQAYGTIGNEKIVYCELFEKRQNEGISKLEEI